MRPTFSVIVATTGRPTLPRALQSLADQPLVPGDPVLLTAGDEVIVVGAGAAIRGVAARFGYRFLEAGPFGDWGQQERQTAMRHARGTHLAFLDDDDVFCPGAFAAMRAAVGAHPRRPVMFKMVAPWGTTIWKDPVVRCGNHGGPQFVCPNDPARLGVWGRRYEGDFDFIVSTLAKYPPDALVWDATVTYVCRPAEAVA